MAPPVLTQTDCPSLKLLGRGKVRDLYASTTDDDALLFVATDRISAYDVIMRNGIPSKGRLLTALSLFWFDLLLPFSIPSDPSDPTSPPLEISHHVISSSLDSEPALGQYASQLEGRTMKVRKSEVVKVEAIVRGYITGSAWSEYKKHGTVHGMPVPAGLRESEKLPEPLFTPSTKADQGEHDENISIEQYETLVPAPLSQQIRAAALSIYTRAAEYAASRGIIIADTKLEFGILSPSSPHNPTPGTPRLILIDELLTPDSSRFWPAEGYAIGQGQASYDKQFVRDYLTSVGFDKNAEVGPELPEDVVRRTGEKYREAYRLLVGKEFEE